MVYTFEYRDDVERDKIIAANSAKYLIEEQNIKEGNFLIFTDVKPIENEVQEIKQYMADTNAMVLELMEMFLMGGM